LFQYLLTDGQNKPLNSMFQYFWKESFGIIMYWQYFSRITIHKSKQFRQIKFCSY